MGEHANDAFGSQRGPLPDRYQTHTAFQPTFFLRRGSLSLHTQVADGEERHLKRMRSLVAVFAVLGVAALALTAWTGLAGASSQKESLTGAGSTFVQPLVTQWIQHYGNADITYAGVG